jgi:blue copper oxidase
VNRREFLGAVVAAASSLTFDRLGVAFQAKNRGAHPPQSSPAFLPNVELELTAEPSMHEIFEGKPTATWSYRGKLLKGRPGTLQPSRSYLGPTIHLNRGDKVRIHFRNQLPESTIIHWHGLAVPALMDGHPRLVIPRGEQYVYEFEVRNRAGHYWYHPHPDTHSGSQVYRGLAGQLFVHDAEEAALRLPSATHEISLAIQDRTFQGSELAYISSPMEAMTGFLGEQVLVNGSLNTQLELASNVYRLRILNASNSRIYKLAWSNGMPFTVIGTDGGLLEQALQKPYLVLGPAERADVIVDLRSQTVGSHLELRSQPFPAPQMMMMGRGMRMSAVEQGAELKILSLRVTRKEKSSFRMPERLSQPAFDDQHQAENAGNARIFPLSFFRMQWSLNDSTFELESVKDNEIWKAGSLQLFEFQNTNRGGRGMGSMMQMAHPMHVHGGQFQVLQRTGSSGAEAMAESLSRGFTDQGWKDTVLVLPGETVRLQMRFPEFKGLFLYHCHNLEHEDMGMMRNYRLI